ncbi:hypothetical protein JYU34_015747 [Plutella xylostella]|uniref:Secreted protein n=1 Tax=Plutella xylostella TaxID=51655 RepID=A0ABQ7Q4U0_PLUXY|nr:hypothetical protein JYU34_015747 [Plutella xylostella]
MAAACWWRCGASWGCAPRAACCPPPPPPPLPPLLLASTTYLLNYRQRIQARDTSLLPYTYPQNYPFTLTCLCSNRLVNTSLMPVLPAM